MNVSLAGDTVTVTRKKVDEKEKVCITATCTKNEGCRLYFP